MITNYREARDEIFSQFASILPSTNAIIGEQLIAVYQGVEDPDKQPTNKFWCRVSQQTVIEPQSVLRADYGSAQKRRYTTAGLVFVQVFSAKTLPENYEKALQLAELIKNAFRGKQTENCVWFRNTRIQELPAEKAWNRVNVVSEYTYDEIG